MPVVCETCGAPLPEGAERCPYAVALDEAPGIGDPARIAAGKMSHADHALHIARWRIHHPDERGATAEVMAWARKTIEAAGYRPST